MADAAQIAALAEITPDSATFHVGTYDDGSGPKFVVKYDATDQYEPASVFLYDGDEKSVNWVSFHWRDVDRLCAVIQQAAAALRARAQQEPSDGE